MMSLPSVSNKGNPARGALQTADVMVVTRFGESYPKNTTLPLNQIAENISSSEDEGELDEKRILESMYHHYSMIAGDNAILHSRVATNFMQNVLHSGSTTCLICIDSVRRSDAIWSCRHCFCSFHLNCIGRWSKDSVAQMKVQTIQQQNDRGYYNHQGEFVPPKTPRSLHWCCPQCREEYTSEEYPNAYECFCGKDTNPVPQSWLLPHSCGEICNKPLKPECGHKCMLLCHPGPCAPCAQTRVTSCICAKSVPRAVRCSNKLWNCNKKCMAVLKCGKHLCIEVCHKPGECPPCSSTSMQPCECGKEKGLRRCCDLKWRCKKVCGALYPCGSHTCQKECQIGPCGECPLGLPRSCPCGKTKSILLCTETMESCGDTCQKMLPCGKHTCAQRCHRGLCQLCIIVTKKMCRCGLHEKELPCWRDFICDTKCKQMRDCGKHACSKKCCDGRCPPCDKICGKPLACKKHKCPSVCHNGSCFPCSRLSQINCRCGKSSKMVPCGRERNVRVQCMESCKLPSKCHHQPQHRCHKNECPPCSEKCGLPNDTTGCKHLCEARCHDAVKVMKNGKNKQYEIKKLPHPRCETKVGVQCFGGHEIAEWPCWNSERTSCQRKCNRLLNCGIHKCTLLCHPVPDCSNMKEQDGCASCKEGCHIPRPKGCVHPCSRPCHLPPCTPCNVNIKSKCHCELMQITYKCSDFYGNGLGTIPDHEQLIQQELLKSCGTRCLKNYACGHRCVAICHSGKCPFPETCRKKVRVFCACNRLRLEVPCDKHRAGLRSLPCDENCIQTRAQIEQRKKDATEQQRRQEEAKNRQEVLQFEKKFGKRKPRERRMQTAVPKKPINWQAIGISVGVGAAVLMAMIVATMQSD